jgi:hypothetical protein
LDGSLAQDLPLETHATRNVTCNTETGIEVVSSEVIGRSSEEE